MASFPARLRWVKHQERWQWQRDQYLGRRDFVRAAMLAWEAWVSRLCSEQGLPGGSGDDTDLNAFNECREVVEAFERDLQMDDVPGRGDAHWTLKHLGNALAHGTPSTARYRPILRDAERLFRKLCSHDYSDDGLALPTPPVVVKLPARRSTPPPVPDPRR